MKSSRNKQDSIRETKEKKIHNPEKTKSKKVPEDYGFDSVRELRKYEKFLK